MARRERPRLTAGSERQGSGLVRAVGGIDDDSVVSVVPDLLDAGEIVLRRQREADVPSLIEAMRASGEELKQWFRWAQREPALAEQTRRAAAADEAFDEGRDHEFVLIEKSTDAVVGSLRLNPHAASNAAGIGYWVRTDRTGRGYATAAAHAATRAPFVHLPQVERVFIHMDVANVARAAIPRKLGYRLDHDEDRMIEAPGQTGRGRVWVTTRDVWL